jgi:hypothetical protein
VGAVDFTEWAAPALVLTFGGRTYQVQPPSVEGAKQVLAAAVRGEVKLGLVKGDIPAEVQEMLDTIGPDDHPALGKDVYDRMVADGLPQATIDRMAYFAVFHWARGREYAETLAKILWLPRETESAGAGGAAPKGSSRRRTGRSSG